MFRFLIIISKTSSHQEEEPDFLEEEMHEKDIQLVNCVENVPKILEQPEAYKICEGCESFLNIEAPTCPSCHSYRFDTDREKIVLYAKSLVSRNQAPITQEDI